MTENKYSGEDARLLIDLKSIVLQHLISKNLLTNLSMQKFTAPGRHYIINAQTETGQISISMVLNDLPVSNLDM